MLLHPRVFLGAGFPVLLLAASLAGAAIPKGDLVIDLVPVASGLAGPVSATHAGDGSGRLFIVEQMGTIRVVDGDILLPAPFLDVRSLLPSLSTFVDERGLLGLAFHPDYENNGRFFIRYSTPRVGSPGEPCFGNCHESVLAEYSVSAGNPNKADSLSAQIIFTVDQPQANHNAGDLAFGPDGFLYVALGDGGGANDGLHTNPPQHGPLGNGQNIETALGSILRIDVDSGTPYAVPPGNPFVGEPGLDEIYAWGFRNPYRFSFDDGLGGSGALYVGDVGQARFEEVDVVTGPGNFGWAIREGFHCFDPFNPNVPPLSCSTTGAGGEPLLDPVVEYDHLDGVSVIGGYVYRGSMQAALFGKYVFGEFSLEFFSGEGRLFYLQEVSPGAQEIREFRIGETDDPYGRFLKGFGEDEAGEIYVCGSAEASPFGTGGVVERLVLHSQTGLPTPVEPGIPLSASPNPFRAGTRIGFDLPQPGRVRLEVLDLRGRRVRTLLDGFRNEGAAEVSFDGRDEAGRALSAGVYLLRLRQGSRSRSGKLVLVP